MTQTVLFQGKATRVSGKFIESGNKAPFFHTGWKRFIRTFTQ